MNSEGEYLQAINLIEDEGERYPDQRMYLAYWQIGLAARDSNPDLAIQYLDELIEEGFWISQYLLRNSPSLESLQDSLEFADRVDAMAALQRAEAQQLLPLLALRKEQPGGLGGQPYPMMIGLHAGRATALASIRFWQPAAENGWLVGVPQSSQAMWSGAYVWEDVAQAQEDLIAHVRELAQIYPIDARRIVLAGHRQGGELAAWLPCSGGMDARGFIAIAPTGVQIANPDRWFHLLQARQPKGMRGAFIVGEQDGRYLPELKRLTDILNAFDVPVRLDILPGVGADFHPDYQDALLRAIDYILT